MPALEVHRGVGEHAAQAANGIRSPGEIRVEDGFGVAAGREGASRRGQVALQRLEVVDLAVVADQAAPIVRPHWLVSTLEVDDRQAAMTEAGDTGGHDVPTIGSAMLQESGATLHEITMTWRERLAAQAEHSKDAAHDI